MEIDRKVAHMTHAAFTPRPLLALVGALIGLLFASAAPAHALSIGLNNGVVEVKGDAQNDTVTFRLNAADPSLLDFYVGKSQTPDGSVPLGSSTPIEISMGGGHDFVWLDDSDARRWQEHPALARRRRARRHHHRLGGARQDHRGLRRGQAERGTGDDDLFGNEGDDTLSGGPGKDRLIGSLGRDSFECDITGEALDIESVDVFQPACIPRALRARIGRQLTLRGRVVRRPKVTVTNVATTGKRSVSPRLTLRARRG
jgi:hypothetical protein